jgi:hypothetical protein
VSEEADSTTTPPTHDPALVEAFDDAQRTSLRMLRDTIRGLKEGMSEWDVTEVAKSWASQYNFVGWFHEPEVLFDGRPRGRRYKASFEPALKPGTVVQIDFAPATETAFGDVGVCFAWGVDAQPPLVTEALALSKACIGYASRWKCTGEVFVFAQGWANNHRRSLEGKAIGHYCFGPVGWKGWMWPTASRASLLMRRNQVQWYNPRRMNGIFAIQPRLVQPDGRVASFEEMVYIDGDTKRLLGRDSWDEIGTWAK